MATSSPNCAEREIVLAQGYGKAAKGSAPFCPGFAVVANECGRIGAGAVAYFFVSSKIRDWRIMTDLFVNPLFWTGLVLIFGLDVAVSSNTTRTIRNGTAQLPVEEQARARRWAFGLAGLLRLVLLLAVLWLIDVGRSAFTLPFWAPSWGQLVLAAGGVFLLYRAVSEMAALFESNARAIPEIGEFGLLLRILELGAVGALLSVDSVFLAVVIGADPLSMVLALIASLVVLMLAGEAIEAVLERHKSLRALVFAVMLVAGAALLGEGLGQGIAKMSLHVAVGIGAAIWLLNTLATRSPRLVAANEPEVPLAQDRTEPLLEVPAVVPIEPVAEPAVESRTDPVAEPGIAPLIEPKENALVDPFDEAAVDQVVARDDETLGAPAQVVQKSVAQSEPRKRGTAKRKTARRRSSSEQG